MKIIPFLALLFFLFPSTVRGEMKYYDGQMLVLQNSKVDLWTIHGLWTCELTGKEPDFYYKQVTDCSPFERFNLNELSGRERSILTRVWLSNNKNTRITYQFWEYEYEKHGSCTTDILPSCRDYLMKATVLWNILKFDDLLGPNGKYKPNTSFQAQDLLDDMEVKYEVRPLLKCNLQGELPEVWFCYTKVWKSIFCASTTDSCMGHIKYVRT
ncbi:putative ribonuclease T(2) [Rosa chinensis]|uniref:Putative ribonuclease T(2) n=1 Tax=Rosa chinensis TaxID=74649 RepID=A0A2P6RCL7_ROSCH|nr:putative ribonuclease T(2) [Rosa chinensis]